MRFDLMQDSIAKLVVEILQLDAQVNLCGYVKTRVQCDCHQNGSFWYDFGPDNVGIFYFVKVWKESRLQH